MRVPRVRLSFLFVILSAALHPLAAQQAQQPASTETVTTQLPANRDPQAVILLQNAYIALGGTTQALPTSFSASGTHTDFLSASPAPYTIRLTALGIDKIRWETELPSGTVTSIIRGRRGWIKDADGTTALSISQVVGQGVENLPLLALAKWTNSPNVLVSLAGVELLDATSVYHLILTESRNPTAQPDSDSEQILRRVRQIDLYIDQKTNLPIRLRYYEHFHDWRRSVPIDLVFSDFRSVGGLFFPFTLSRYRGGQLASQTKIESATLNVSATDDLFWVSQP
jgi:hypothetical protein